MKLILSLFTFLFLCAPEASCPPDRPVSQGNADRIVQLKRQVVGIKQVVSKAAYESTGTVQKSGFLVDKKRGWILTTVAPVGLGPVVSTYEVTFEGGRKAPAKSLYKDPLFNIQVLQVQAKDVPSDLPEDILAFREVGPGLEEPVLLLGKNEEQLMIQQGVVASVHESRGLVTAYQSVRVSLNTPGSQGQQGGASFDKDGFFVGIIAQADQTFASLIWPSYVKEVLSALRSGTTPPRVRIVGARVETQSLADAVNYLGLPPKHLQNLLEKYPQALAHGLVVTESAAEASLEAGDVVVAIDGKEVGFSLAEFHNILAQAKDGKVVCAIVRQEKELTVEVTIQDVWPHVIKRMILFGGALFYESDLLMQALYGVPPKSLMASKALPGSVFSGVLPAFPTRSDPTSIAVISKMAELSMINLDDLKKAIPTLGGYPRFAVWFKDYGASVSGGLLQVLRVLQVGQVDFLASTSIPEELVWSDQKLAWESNQILIPNQKCVI